MLHAAALPPPEEYELSAPPAVTPKWARECDRVRLGSLLRAAARGAAAASILDACLLFM
jgi:hypothetical protein